MKSVLLLLISTALSFGVVYAFVKAPIPSRSTPINKNTKLIKSNLFSLEQAPSRSLRGTLTSITGDIKLQTRLATEPATVSSVKEIQQGEALVTGEDGSLAVEFENHASLNISAESNVDFVQTLPEHIVVIQREGIVQYKTEKDTIMSVRSMHLVTDIAKNSDVTIEKEAELLIFTVKKGRVDVAFNNLENFTTTATIHEGESYIFNNETREGEIE